MKLKIFLDSDSYEWLWSHVPLQALSRAALRQAVLLGHTRVIDCDDVEARDLLSSAQGHCPGAVRGITEAMRNAGLTPKIDHSPKQESQTDRIPRLVRR